MKKVLLILILLSFLPVLVYIYCISPSVYWEDAGEFITTSKNLGIAHPPGHPLYIVLSHLFTIKTSPQKTAIAVNTFSVFCSFLSILFFSIFLYLFIKPKNLSLFYLVLTSSLFLFSFSLTFWYFTEIAEVYSLHTLLSIILFISLFLFYKKGGKFILLFSFLFGLSLANNITIGFLLPSFLLFIILERRKVQRKFILFSFLLFSLGISFYIYIPIRAQFNPIFNWGNAKTFTNFLFLFVAKEFSKDFFTFTYAETSFIPFGLNLLREISYWGIIPLFFGFYKLLKKERNLFILFLSSIFFTFFFSFVTGRGPDFYAYFLPVIPIFFILIGFGLFNLFNFVKSKRLWIYLTTLCLLSLLPLFLNYERNCRRNDYDAINYGYSILKWLPQDAVLMTENTNDFFILIYLKEIEDEGNFTLLYLPLFKESWYKDFIRSAGFDWKGELTPLSFSKQTKMECFYTPGAGISLPVKNLQPSGPLFKIVEEKEHLKSNRFSLPSPLFEKGKKRYAILFSRFGEYYFRRKKFLYSIETFEKAKFYDSKNPAIYHNLAVLYRYIKDFEKSKLYEEKAKKLGF
ncbi:DUF2723 domain-containing protein [candidate division WOR-3 bacterium]|nr:DUF2723 domain-containing protein [candidate division WOR-3 bacterium]